MQVCFVSGTYPPSVHGGAENYVRRTATALQERGHDVSVLTTKPYDGPSSLVPTREVYEDVEVWRFFPANLSHESECAALPLPLQAGWRVFDAINPHAAAATYGMLARKRPDVVHTNNLTGISTLSAHGAGKVGAKHVHTVHDYGLVCPNSSPRVDSMTNDLETLGNHPSVCRTFSRLQQWLLNVPDVVTGPSQHILDVHEQRGFFETTDCVRLRLGVENIVETVPRPPANPCGLYVGRLTGIKGIDVFLRAAAALPSVDFRVCGTGPQRDLVERVASELDNVKYFGYVSDTDLLELRRTSSFAVVPSIWMDNSPFTVYESFSAGIPVIASDIGGIPELITPTETGLLFEPGSVSSLADVIKKILSRDIYEMKLNARRWAANHTLDKHVDRLVSEVYASPDRCT